MDMKVKTVAAESGHWYCQKTGEPRYTLIGKNGVERPTTLRDARKLGLYPSVTSIINVMDKPGLNKWLIDQAIDSALTLPRLDGEDLDAFKERVLVDYREQSNKARDLGTEIHGAIETWMHGGEVREHRPICELVEKELLKHFGQQDWSSEHSFAHPLGFGGKVDLHTDGIVADFKTTKFLKKGQISLPSTYETHAMQLAAYAHGLLMPEARGSIVFVATDVEMVHIVDLDEEAMTRGWRMFQSALQFWFDLKDYYPMENCD